MHTPTDLNADGPTMPHAGYWRLAPTAARLGLTPDLLRAALARGDIPIRVLRLGARRLIFCHAGDVAAVLRGRTRPAADDASDLF